MYREIIIWKLNVKRSKLFPLSDDRDKTTIINTVTFFIIFFFSFDPKFISRSFDSNYRYNVIRFSPHTSPPSNTSRSIYVKIRCRVNFEQSIETGSTGGQACRIKRFLSPPVPLSLCLISQLRASPAKRFVACEPSPLQVFTCWSEPNTAPSSSNTCYEELTGPWVSQVCPPTTVDRKRNISTESSVCMYHNRLVSCCR